MEWPALSWNFTALPRRPVAVHEVPINEMLLRSYRERVTRVAHLLMSNSSDATQVIHETFLKLSQNTERFRADPSLRVLVFRVTVSTIRSRQRWWEWRAHRPPSSAANDEEAVIRQGLRRLSRDLRLILVLRDIEGLSYSEIAEVLGLQKKTVKFRLGRARSQMLRSVIGREVRGLIHHE